METNRGQPLRILVVDDQRDCADAWALLLRLDGHEVLVAYDGVDAAVLAEDKRPDAVLSDLSMPRLDGCGVAARLRALADYAPLLVAVTARDSAEDRRRAKVAGFDDYLVKPTDPNLVRSLLREFRQSGGRRPPT